MTRDQNVTQIWVLVYKWGTEKIWGIYGEFVDKINIFPINYQYIINKMPTQLKINCFPINYLQILLYFKKFSLFYPLPNPHFFNIPTYCQQIFLNQACKASNLMGQGEIYYYGQTLEKMLIFILLIQTYNSTNQGWGMCGK